MAHRFDGARKPPGRRPAFRGVLVNDVSQGQERTRAWPRKRGRRRTTAERASQDKFYAANLACKFMAPQIVSAMTAAVKGTPLMPRDLLISMLYGRLAAFIMDDGRKLWPVTAKADVMEALDTITQTPGDILLRTADGWVGYPLQLSAGFCEIWRNGNYSSSSAGWQAVPWNAVTTDPLSMWQASEQGWRVPSAGLYLLNSRVMATADNLHAQRVLIDGVVTKEYGPNLADNEYGTAGAILLPLTGPSQLVTHQFYVPSIRTIQGQQAQTYAQLLGPI